MNLKPTYRVQLRQGEENIFVTFLKILKEFESHFWVNNKTMWTFCEFARHYHHIFRTGRILTMTEIQENHLNNLGFICCFCKVAAKYVNNATIS